MSSNLGLDFSKFILKMVNPSDRGIYEFGDFRLDAAHLMLYRRGEEVPLAPKTVETLVALVERRGEIVSKDELLEAVWPDAVVEESNLFLYLSILRKTLGNQHDGEPWVQTLRRRGYRFTGEVKLAAANAENGGSPPELIRPVGAGFKAGESTAVDVPDVPVWRINRPVFYAAAGLIALVIAFASGYQYFFDKHQIDSIAVMPLKNDNAELEYLPDGLTDNLIGSLLKIPGLDVKARSTMLRYKESDLDAAAIGRELDVQVVLSPRLVQRGEDLTLYVELVDTRTENSLWQQTYNRTTSQLGLLQRDVIRDVVRELSIDVPDSAKQRIAKNYTENEEANRLYLNGLSLIRKLTEPQIREGIVYLRQATELDPSYAPAFAMIATAHRSLTLCCDTHPSELVEGRAAAERALALDDNLAEAHSALAASLYQQDWDFEGAEEHYQRALELDPNSAISHLLYGDFLTRMDRQDEAASEIKRARELEPFSPLFNAFALPHGNPDTALDRIKFTIGLDPSFHFSHYMAAGVYRRREMYADAKAAFQKAKELAPEQTWSDVVFSAMLAATGEAGQSRAILDDLLRRSESRYVPPFHIASIYNQLGDTEQALAWLEKAYQVRDPKLTFIKTIPAWRKLDSDPRFQDIRRRVGL